MTNITNLYFANNNIRYVIIDGNTCNNLENCYNILQQQLNIPDYFGYNLDALEEVLADLEWIAEESIIIILLNVDTLLRDELLKKEDFLHIFSTVSNNSIKVFFIS